MLPASKAVRATICLPLCRQNRITQISSGIKTAVVKDLLRGLLDNCYGVRTRLPGFRQKNRLSTSLRLTVFTGASTNLSKLIVLCKLKNRVFYPRPDVMRRPGFLLE